MKSISSGTNKTKCASTTIKNYIKFYSQKTTNKKIKKQDEPSMFDMVSSYYGAYSFDDSYPKDMTGNILSCNALKFIKNIISLLSKPLNVEKGNLLPKNFYKKLIALKNTNSFLDDMDEKEQERNYRQAAHVMEAAGMFKRSKGKVSVDFSFESDADVYFALLKAFWHLTEWDQIFPLNVDVDMAKAFHFDRSIFKDILLKERKEKRIYVQKIADYFSDLTGISNKGDLILAFFLDFYLLKWLEHFNLVKCHKGSGAMPVSFEISSFASEIFANIS